MILEKIIFTGYIVTVFISSLLRIKENHSQSENIELAMHIVCGILFFCILANGAFF